MRTRSDVIARTGGKEHCYMKTIEEFIKELDASEALQEEITAVEDMNALGVFLKKYDIDASAGAFRDALKAKLEGELSDDDVEAVAGGASEISASGFPWMASLVKIARL